MFFSPKALLGFASLVGLIVPGILSAPSGLTVAAREIVDVEAREAVDVGVIHSPNLLLSTNRFRPGVSVSTLAKVFSLRQALSAEITVVLNACSSVQTACQGVPAPHAAGILAALKAFFDFLLKSTSTSNASSSCLGAIFSGLYTSTLVNFLTTLIGCTIRDVIAALTNGGVTALWLLCGGLPTGLNAAETAFCKALGLLYAALATALNAGCLPSLIAAILVAINTLLSAILALVAAVSTCTICSLTSVLILAINALVAGLVTTLRLIH
ncbi:hypothetical protein K438DRAFT_1754106 [Mycena galopus ATCC 62051]|nr:hypothetical protein K438DRAFT_1754106 [Mycena galopus ATCC 62051]